MSQPEGGAPQLRLEVDVRPDATFVHCFGRLVLESGTMLRTEVHRLIRPGARLVLDLTSVTHCDSMGLGGMIALYVSARSGGSRLELINLGPQVRRLFSMTNLLSLFEPAADSTCRIP
jgi:anti-sigma B factor antagonist